MKVFDVDQFGARQMTLLYITTVFCIKNMQPLVVDDEDKP